MGSPGNTPSSSPHTYTTLTTLLKSHGAEISETITPKTFHSVISTESARKALTQKVRKGVKRGVKILDVKWIENCIKFKKICEVVVGEDDVTKEVEDLMKSREKGETIDAGAGVATTPSKPVNTTSTFIPVYLILAFSIVETSPFKYILISSLSSYYSLISRSYK